MIDVETFSVLLVEDNPIDRKVLLRDLQRYADATFAVSVAESLADCDQLAAGRRFDCVLLDLTLPDSSGLSTVNAVLDIVDDCPVIVLTGLSDPTFAVEAVAAGAQDYLVKGQVDSEVVGRSIRYTVARHRTEQRLRATEAHLDVLRDRERIARDLHDTVIQQLFATGMGLQSLAGRVDNDDLRTMITTTIAEIDAGIQQLRQAVFDLHTTGASTGLVIEIRELVEARAASLALASEAFIDPRIDLVPAAIGENIRATVAESIANVAKHADASMVTVNIVVDGEAVRLEVLDDGQGFDESELPERGYTGHGLVNMRQRAESRGGTMEVASRPSGGTALVWSVPVT